MPGRFAGVVQPVLCKFYRKSVKWRLVKACDESLHNLPCKQFQIGKLLEFLLVDHLLSI
jgi:hypothetical protein